MSKKIIILIILLVFSGFFLLNLFAYNHAHSMLYYSQNSRGTKSPEDLSFFNKINVLVTGVTMPRPRGIRTPQSVGLAYNEITIPGSQGIQLGAWYCPVENSEKIVILFHGYSSDKSSLLEEASEFYNLGISVLLVDFRGSGDSSESYTSIGYYEALDVVSSFKYTKDVLGYDYVIFFGKSMGGVAIFRALHTSDINPNLIIVESMFDTMLNTVKNRFDSMGIPSFPGAQLLVFWGGIQMGFNGFVHNPVSYAASVNCPVLFLHGEHDPRAQLTEARRVYEILDVTKDFIVFPGVKHESCCLKHRYIWVKNISQFISQ